MLLFCAKKNDKERKKNILAIWQLSRCFFMPLGMLFVMKKLWYIVKKLKLPVFF